MKKQRMALYLVALCCFLACFIVLNRKYDRFYRINGINNENRLLITTYLTEDEQNYLVENSFPMDRFVRFIQYDDFYLRDLEYYEQIETKMKWRGQSQKVLTYTNKLLEKIRHEETVGERELFDQLIDSPLLDSYMAAEDFDITLFNLYEAHYEVTGAVTAEDIKRINDLSETMNTYRWSLQDQTAFLSEWNAQYTLDNLIDFFELKKASPQLALVKNPQSLTTLIKENQTVASYEPSPLTIPYEVSRTRFACYLRQDACAAIEELTDAASEAVSGELLLLVDAYSSYDGQEMEYANQESEKRGGSSEYQLGLTVDFMVMGISYSNFEQTAMSDYLKDHSWEFGFIQRYPDAKSENYSANTYRFVGKDAARVMHEKNLSLEAYEGVEHE